MATEKRENTLRVKPAEKPAIEEKPIIEEIPIKEEKKSEGKKQNKH